MAKSLPRLYAADFTEVRMAPGRMAKAAAWSDLTGTARPDKPWLDGMPRMIFVGDMGDVLSEAVAFEYLKAELIDVALSAKGRRHIWMVLTKRPNRLANFRDWLLADHGIPWPGHIWVGTSITSKASANRAEILRHVHAPVKFLSVEPLIESVEFAADLLRDFRLVIVGGESGPKARPFDIEWARSIRDDCKRAGVAFFMKQMGANVRVSSDSGWPLGVVRLESYGECVGVRLKDSHGGDMIEWPADLRVRQMPGGAP